MLKIKNYEITSDNLNTGNVDKFTLVGHTSFIKRRGQKTKIIFDFGDDGMVTCNINFIADIDASSRTPSNGIYIKILDEKNIDIVICNMEDVKMSSVYTTSPVEFVTQSVNEIDTHYYIDICGHKIGLDANVWHYDFYVYSKEIV